MRVLVTGCSHWKDPDAVYERLARLSPDTTIIHGCGVGVDTFAGWAAKKLGFTVEEFPPNFARYGEKATGKRNVAMTEASPDVCIAFWDGQSSGTFHTMYNAYIRDVPIEVVMAKLDVRHYSHA